MRPLIARLLTTTTLCAMVLLLAGPAVAGRGREASPELQRGLGEAWVILEAGNFDQAGDLYSALLATAEGRDHAEVYYGLGLIAWEKRDALAARGWLWAAHRGQLESGGWNPGVGQRWQRRIEERLNFIQGNFTLRKFEVPPRGEPIPPLADPIPRDPVLAEFAAAVPRVLKASLKRVPDGPVFLMLPNGSWWVGDRLEWHDGGAMEPTEAGESWPLVTNSGVQAEAHEGRVAELAAGGSLGRQLIGKLMIARRAPREMLAAELQRRKAEHLAAEYARRKPQLEAMRARQRALLDAGRRDEAERLVAQFHSGEPGAGVALLTWAEVTPSGLAEMAQKLGEVWTEPGWHMRYAVVIPDKSTKWTLELPDLGVMLSIEKGGYLLIQGTSQQGKERVKERLLSWHLGGRPNKVDVWFDGIRLKVSANGQVVGPVAVARFAPSGATRWRLAMSDEEALMFDVRVERFDGF